MKKLTAIFLILVLCASMTACVMMGTPGDGGGNKVKVDPNAPAQILLDESSVRTESHYDEDGICIGYYRFTEGTNCGEQGLVRLEFLDLNRNVVNVYEPKMAGAILGYGSRGSEAITEIWESDYKQTKTNSNSYLLYPYENGNPYVYTENREGVTVRCDLYDVRGNVVRSLTPEDPENQLKVYQYQVNCFSVAEQYYVELANGSHACIVRDLTYDMEGDLLCEIVNTIEENTERMMMELTRAEVKNGAGQTLRIYERSLPDSELMVSYNPNDRMLNASESKYIYEPTMGVLKAFEEYFDVFTNTVLYRKEKTFDGVTTTSTKITLYGGELVTTKWDGGGYCKLEIYDAAGVLKKTYEAPEGGILGFRWDALDRAIRVTVYDGQGNIILEELYPQ